jgi:Holliday junction DNA helicase RuvA
MIGSVRGRITLKVPPQLMVEVAGIGYELEAPMSTFLTLPGVGEEVHLLTHLVVREDAHVLYAFASEAERRLFRSLIKVSGVGPKIAMALLSGMPVSAFAACVQQQDVSALTRIPGIGRKTAERLILELKDKLGAGEAIPERPAQPLGAASPESEAYDALISLGYRPAEATRLLKAAGSGAESTEELIRRALQGAVRE